mmetsp:Transcript_60722/g.136817  ORF Transcript_60722/g.136817 Transcript_60722/m.136817 type:complete len:207 (-) Transcript_60722:262-882(-)
MLGAKGLSAASSTAKPNSSITKCSLLRMVSNTCCSCRLLRTWKPKRNSSAPCLKISCKVCRNSVCNLPLHTWCSKSPQATMSKAWHISSGRMRPQAYSTTLARACGRLSPATRMGFKTWEFRAIFARTVATLISKSHRSTWCPAQASDMPSKPVPQDKSNTLKLRLVDASRLSKYFANIQLPAQVRQPVLESALSPSATSTSWLKR